MLNYKLHARFRTMQTSEITKRPEWLKVRVPNSKSYHDIRGMLKDLNLATVCQEALCPNIEECWGGGTATFMLMGDTCTRACRFCAVKTGNPKGVLDEDEPEKVGYAISQMKLDYVVLTSVDRDDLDDLGSGHFAKTIATIKQHNPKMIVECLTPDFGSEKEFIKKVIDSGPEVFAHNIETVERLTPTVRDRRSQYRPSLETLRLAKEINPKQYTKTSIMLGLGERDGEVIQSLHDLREVGCDVVTFGQYLAPTARHKKFLPVLEYVHPDKFQMFQEEAERLGFMYVASGPLVRSSYKAGEYFMKGTIEKDRREQNKLKTYPVQ